MLLITYIQINVFWLNCNYIYVCYNNKPGARLLLWTRIYNLYIYISCKILIVYVNGSFIARIEVYKKIHKCAVQVLINDDRKITDDFFNIIRVLTQSNHWFNYYHNANLSLGLPILCCDHFLYNRCPSGLTCEHIRTI